ncbi:MAG: NAD(P)H-binding protein, partial [Desulfuromonadales bacterium]|nr:NAD(P)H-binding protein [Desulfuromonadales bacterium]
MVLKMKKVLVTGATGFLGRRVVLQLVEQGFAVRALVRQTSNIQGLHLPGVEFVYGDVTDPDSLLPAFTDIDYVIHAAAGTSGSEEQMRRVTIEGTRNILDLCRRS